MSKQNESDKVIVWLFSGITIVAVILTVMIMYAQNENATVSFTSEEKRLRDSISILQKEIEASHIRQDKLQHDYDSMLHVEPQIIYETREKIKFVYTEASPSQLDSIIRTKSKRKHRYH